MAPADLQSLNHRGVVWRYKISRIREPQVVRTPFVQKEILVDNRQALQWPGITMIALRLDRQDRHAASAASAVTVMNALSSRLVLVDARKQRTRSAPATKNPLRIQPAPASSASERW